MRRADAMPTRSTLLLEDPGIDAILVLNCPTGLASSTGGRQAVADAIAKADRARP